MMMWRKQRLFFFSISLRFFFPTWFLGNMYESSLFCLKSTKIVQKSQETPVLIGNSLRALLYTLLKEKRDFFKVCSESFHRVVVWNQNRWQEQSYLKCGGPANENPSGPFFSPARLREKLVSSSLVSSLPLLSEDWSPAFGLYKTNLGEEWKSGNGGKRIFKKIGLFLKYTRKRVILKLPFGVPDNTLRLNHMGHCFMQIYLQLSIKRISSVPHSSHRCKLANVPNAGVYKLNI